MAGVIEGAAKLIRELIPRARDGRLHVLQYAFHTGVTVYSVDIDLPDGRFAMSSFAVAKDEMVGKGADVIRDLFEQRLRGACAEINEFLDREEVSIAESREGFFIGLKEYQQKYAEPREEEGSMSESEIDDLVKATEASLASASVEDVWTNLADYYAAERELQIRAGKVREKINLRYKYKPKALPEATMDAIMEVVKEAFLPLAPMVAREGLAESCMLSIQDAAVDEPVIVRETCPECGRLPPSGGLSWRCQTCMDKYL